MSGARFRLGGGLVGCQLASKTGLQVVQHGVLIRRQAQHATGQGQPGAFGLQSAQLHGIGVLTQTREFLVKLRALLLASGAGGLCCLQRCDLLLKFVDPLPGSGLEPLQMGVATTQVVGLGGTLVTLGSQAFKSLQHRLTALGIGSQDRADPDRLARQAGLQLGQTGFQYLSRLDLGGQGPFQALALLGTGARSLSELLLGRRAVAQDRVELVL